MNNRRHDPAMGFADILSNLKTADGIFVTDEHQRVICWSESAERIRGIPESDALGRRCYEVLVGTDFSGQPFCRTECPIIRNARKQRAVRDYELVVKDRAGRRRLISNSILLWPGERDHAVVHLFREMKSRKPLPAIRRPGGAKSADTSPTPVSRREHEVLQLAATGLRTAEIAESLGVSVYTARNQLSSVMRKLNVRSRVEAIIVAAESGLL